MEAVEEALGSNSSEYSSCNGEFMQRAVVAKGRRTKRRRIHQRPVQSMVVAAADSSSASSAELSESITEEDEHMANCLILLAQGRTSDAAPKPESPDGGGGGVTEKFTSSRFAEAAAATTTGGKAGFDVYECKTCSKSFPSFQALGGHRASHKKPKLAAAPSATVAEERKAMVHDEYTLQTSMNSLSTPVTGIDQSNGKAKIHECSICGSEFNSGQALGGHMRRHRPAVVVPEMQEGKKDRSLLSLDLNLPAPADDVVEPPRPPSPPPFAFAVNLSVVFPATASALVDCHY